ncbi:TrkA family potassium uptake protein (plasmid) [Pontibacillus sp. ALD_SL1]|uniref:potassium channel family protein n=1 Tax=Pontibacillus sp. ALD_SL1 TaxID=2777185 RepID=UPI001A95AFBF|nr:TrkA family potassium uptake protein [Pontibacillus sp. ALD_SL1]QST02835.1 TrkA family potassium uptake protein [Pontibacillus sp. ALD_SL1]
MGKKFLVIGVGRFGRSVIRELHSMNHDVVAVDVTPSLLEEIDPYTNHTMIGDATDDALLAELNVLNYDGVVVSIGDNTLGAILIVKKLKKLGCKRILSKANSETIGEILGEVGAHNVVYPEAETGVRVARKLANPGLLEVIELAPHFVGIEMQVPEDFVGKTLSELQFRRKYRATVVMVAKPGGKPNVSPNPDDTLEEGDLIFVVGDTDDLERLKRKV